MKIEFLVILLLPDITILSVAYLQGSEEFKDIIDYNYIFNFMKYILNKLYQVEFEILLLSPYTYCFNKRVIFILLIITCFLTF